MQEYAIFTAIATVQRTYSLPINDDKSIFTERLLKHDVKIASLLEGVDFEEKPIRTNIVGLDINSDFKPVSQSRAKPVYTGQFKRAKLSKFLRDRKAEELHATANMAPALVDSPDGSNLDRIIETLNEVRDLIQHSDLTSQNYHRYLSIVVTSHLHPRQFIPEVRDLLSDFQANADLSMHFRFQTKYDTSDVEKELMNLALGRYDSLEHSSFRCVAEIAHPAIHLHLDEDGEVSYMTTA